MDFLDEKQHEPTNGDMFIALTDAFVKHDAKEIAQRIGKVHMLRHFTSFIHAISTFVWILHDLGVESISARF